MKSAINISSSALETKLIASNFIKSLDNKNVNIFLSGDLGAGKTQFVKGIFEGLDYKNSPTSPTYDLVLSYKIGELLVNHLDLYRIEVLNLEDEIWINQILSQECLNIVEWGNKFEFDNLLKPEYIIHISVIGENERKIEIFNN
jgi:tRNA threonylcarbamoyladenosine biosynthesis protein TsaE